VFSQYVPLTGPLCMDYLYQAEQRSILAFTLALSHQVFEERKTAGLEDSHSRIAIRTLHH